MKFGNCWNLSMAVAEFEFEEEGDERVSGFGSQEWIRYQAERYTGLERYSVSKRFSTQSKIAFRAR